MKQKIIPNLWFDRQAEEAANFYTSVFEDSRVGNITRAPAAGFEIHGLPEGTVMTVEFEVEGYQFIGINGGPIFKFTPAISFLVSCNNKEKVDTIWARLSSGGTPMMQLGSYPFSERYGWIQDRYGLSWQLMTVSGSEINRRITPTLMFVGEHYGQAEEAVNYYTSVFRDTRVDHIMRYGSNQAPDKKGTIQHAGFTLENQDFAAMDSAQEHNFTFNEATSLMITCSTQKEIDYYWGKLTDGGQESMCGWLKDKFGASWQVAPVILSEMLLDPDKEKVERVTGAFLKMKKFNIGALKKAYKG